MHAKRGGGQYAYCDSYVTAGLVRLFSGRSARLVARRAADTGVVADEKVWAASTAVNDLVEFRTRRQESRTWPVQRPEAKKRLSAIVCRWVTFISSG